MTITRFRPLGDIVSLRDAMDRLFEDSFVRPDMWANGSALAVPVDLWESKDAYHLKADVPGMTPDDIDINVTQDTVTISGEVKAASSIKDDEAWLRQERRSGKFTRSFTLPVAIDANKVDATFQSGVLHLTLPKSEAVRPRQIKVRATTSQQ